MPTILSRKPGGSGGGGGPPSGAAGGDLTGTYPNPTIGAGKVTAAQVAPDVATQSELDAVQAQILFDGYALLRDQQASGTHGGTFTAGAWRTRVLNTESFDVGGIVTLAANQFTLQAGTYWLYARAPAYIVTYHKAKLANITDTADTLVGATSYGNGATGNAMNDSIVQGRFTIAAAKAFEIQHFCVVTEATDGFGLGRADFGVIEVFTEVQIWREAP